MRIERLLGNPKAIKHTMKYVLETGKLDITYCNSVRNLGRIKYNV